MQSSVPITEPQQPAAEGQPTGEDQLRLSWRYPPGLIGLSSVNLALRVVTLGIYHFWAKTEVRKRIWSAVRINDEPLTYTGRGMELFLGFLIVFGAVLLPIMLGITGLYIAFGPLSIIPQFAIFGLYVLFAYLIGIAVYRAQRYRLARTRWRGIRGALVGSPTSYAWTYFWTMILIPFTLGWIVPWRTTRLQSMITNNVRFGDRPMQFDATPGPLYGPFALLWVGSIVLYFAVFGGIGLYMFPKVVQAQQSGLPFVPSTLDFVVIVTVLIGAGLIFALISAWYRARTINHFANHTRFENAHFRGGLSAGGLIWLSISNFLILIAGAVLLIAIAAGVVAPFVEFDNLRAPEGRAVTQVMFSLLPLALIIGFTLFAPIVQARTAGYIVRNLEIEGTAPLADIAQRAGADIKYGEGLAEAFDVDAF